MKRSPKKAPVNMDASLALEMEVGDDSAAYKMTKADLAEFLADEECALCGDMLDAFGECLNPLCESNDDF